ncbi:DUF2637 domain-containing protein [Streptomyces sp. XH2]|uniref:DUF2637 domain-containing protein n=1 Tax=Streptomyces sp. XH2 TaxID=3412483 RepID=UPI003C7ED5F4
MNLSQWALPAGMAVAGIGAVVAVAMLLAHWRRGIKSSADAKERAELDLQRRQAWRRRLAVIALAIGCVMMFVLAGIAAWLSFGAQREYAHAHNGGDWDAATGFALLLDAGALSLSLIRFFEALTLRSSGLTRLLLFVFVASSAQMNLLHAPESGAGGAFLSVVPPLVYAVLLEMLLVKIEQVITGRNKQNKPDQERGYSRLLWLPWPIGAPVQMWKKWRSELLATIENVRAPGSQSPLAPPMEPVPNAPVTPEPVVPEAASPETVASEPVVPEPAVPAPAEPAGAKVLLDKPAAAQLPPPAPEPAPEVAAHVPQPADAATAPAPAGPPPAALNTPDPAPEPAQVPEPAPEPEPAPDPAEATERPNGKARQEDTPIVGDLPETATEAEGEAPSADAADAADMVEEVQEADETEDPAGAPEPDPQTGAAAGEEPVTSPPAAKGAVTSGDAAEERQDDVRHDRPAPGAGGDEVRERPRMQIDLSSLPANEGPRQLAERIYVAHYVAGLPLDKGDLAKWAGYKNPHSGGNEYRRLERLYGPILEKDGAGYVDLDWSSLEQHADTIAAQQAA